MAGTPSSSRLPPESRDRPASARISVDLPDPDAPTTPTNSPGRMERDTPSRIRRRAPPDRTALVASTSATANPHGRSDMVIPRASVT